MLCICPQVERIHESGSRDGLATAIMEHANTLVSLAGALYAMQRFPAAVEAYEQSLVVFELVEDVDRITKVLLNLHNMAEIQVRASAVLEVRDRGKGLAICHLFTEPSGLYSVGSRPCSTLVKYYNGLGTQPIQAFLFDDTHHDVVKWSWKYVEPGLRTMFGTKGTSVGLHHSKIWELLGVLPSPVPEK